MHFPGIGNKIPRRSYLQKSIFLFAKKSIFCLEKILGFVQWTSAFSDENFVQWTCAFSGGNCGFVQWTSAFSGEKFGFVEWTSA
jgi:hypothetical protein